MSRAARTMSRSGVYHILFRGVNQQNIFEEKADYEKLKEAIIKVKEEMEFEIYAYCLMSNHVHMVLKEKEVGDISLIMKRILTKYARWYNIKYGRSGALIANRYKSIPVEVDEYFIPLIRYIHQNSIRAGIVESLEEYPHSSYIEYVGEEKIADTSFLFGIMEKDRFVAYHKEIDGVKFVVSDSTKKTDEEVLIYLKKAYKIENPKNIAKMSKLERNEILAELKKHFPVRQLQRLTGVSRGVITRIK